MATFRDFKSSFPEDSHAKGKAFEGFLGDWFFKNHPLYRHKFVKVWQWADWPKPDGVAAQDLGTDLIAEDTEGKICAIQAKFYDVDSAIKFKDISTFLADSSKDYVDYRLLIGTAELAPNARKQLQSQQKPVQAFLLHDFDAWDYDWPKSLADIKKAPIKEPHEARPHQQAAIDDVCSKLDGRGQLIMACGTGKTLTGQRITEALESETTLVLLPSLLLLSGTMNEWLQHTKVGFHYLPVCSDASIGGKAAPETHFTSGELGNASTTDPDEIREFLKQKGNKVIFSTYQSSGRVAEAIQGTKTRFDLILADEAHRCAGKVAADYGFVLDAKKLPALNRLFMTATPRIYKSSIKKAAKDADIQIASMDDETVFGPVVHHLTFGKAIEDKLLTDYQVVVVGVNDTAVGEMVDERALVKTEAGLERDAQTLGSQLGLMKAVKKYDLHRVITFHSRINQARDYAVEFLEVMDATKKKDKPSGTITYSHVSGAMPTAERTNKLRALGLLEHEDRYLLGNARCLSEGVDVPALDGVAFVDPRRSEIDIIQAVGRAIRKSSNKTKGTIIIPVFIEEGDDPDLVLSSSAFDQVWKVVNALRAHDEKLGEELDQLRRAEGRGERVSIEDTKLIFDVHESVGDSFLQAFETKLVEATTESWEFWFGLLEKYYRENGNTLVPVGYSHDNQKLGIWVHRQRSIQHEISEDRRDRLNSLEFVWDVMALWWLEAIEALTLYKEKNGDCLVPGHYVFDGFALGNWVGKQRAAQLKGELAPERLTELESLDFVWDVTEHMWELGFQALGEYKKEIGDCLVPARHSRKADNFKLGTWVQTQRYTRAKLSKDQIERLNDIGFVWDPLEIGWEEGIEAFRAFAAREGHSVVPARHREGDFNLGVWLGDQRKLFKKGQLSNEKQAALNQLGLIWDPLEKQWADMYSLLLDYQREQGHCNVPASHREGGVKLGLWVQNTRRQFGSLSEKRIKQLNHAGFIWDLAAYNWDSGFAALKRYKKEYGDCLVPAKYSADAFALGFWVGHRRKDYKKGALTGEQIQALEGLGFEWSPFDSSWERAFEMLRRYKKIHGDCAVPSDFFIDEFHLGRWVSGQRTSKQRGLLSDDRAELLNDLGFVWDALEHHWETGYRLLRAFKKQNGHCRVPQELLVDTFKLGQWVSKIRVDESKGKLSSGRKAKLEKLGFTWNMLEYRWQTGIAALKTFRKEHGHCRVPSSYVVADYQLGQWVATARKNRSTLDTDRVAELDELGFIWDLLKQQWEQGFASLEQYYKTHGHCLVPHGHIDQDDFKLGLWVSRHRQPRAKITREQVARLNDIGFVWDPQAFRWEQGFSALEQFHKVYGNCLVPKKYRDENGYSLGVWVSGLRQNVKKLSKERIKRLNALGFIWDLAEYEWQKAFLSLQKYQLTHGHCSVPKGYKGESGFSLRDWVRRQKLKKAQLTDQQIQQLDSLGYAWEASLQTQWEQWISALKSYVDQFGDPLVPSSYVTVNGMKLGAWVSQCRVKRNKGVLKADRVTELENLGFVWKTKES